MMVMMMARMTMAMRMMVMMMVMLDDGATMMAMIVIFTTMMVVMTMMMAIVITIIRAGQLLTLSVSVAARCINKDLRLARGKRNRLLDTQSLVRSRWIPARWQFAQDCIKSALRTCLCLPSETLRLPHARHCVLSELLDDHLFYQAGP